ncbi:unnamed protein product [Musa acuminata var. zebrina]
MRCHLSLFSLCRSPLIWRTLSPSSTSSFFTPGRSALRRCASGVSFHSTRVLAKAEVGGHLSEKTEGIEGVTNVEGEGIEEVAARDDRHLCSTCNGGLKQR